MESLGCTPKTGKSGILQFTGSQRVRHDWLNNNINQLYLNLKSSENWVPLSIWGSVIHTYNGIVHSQWEIKQRYIINHWQRLKNHIYNMIPLHKNTRFYTHVLYYTHTNSESLNKTLHSVYLCDERWRIRHFSLYTKSISNLILWQWITYVIQFFHFWKKGFFPPFLIAYSIPVGFEYVWHIFYPLGHVTHCLTCQVSLSWDISIGCTANLENSAVATDWKRSVFIPIPKKGNAKECSNYHTIALISHASKVMLKILQVRLQQCVNCELPDIQAGFRKGRGTRDQIANIHCIIKKASVPEKHLLLLYWLYQSLWLYGSQQTVENYERDGNTKPPDLPLEKPVCRSGSNS